MRNGIDSIMSLNEVLEITGLSRTTIWRYEREGIFPHRVQLGPRRVGYPRSKIEHWMQSLSKKAVLKQY